MQLKFLLFLLAMISFDAAFGQYKPEQFGQNRVQYKKFDWQYYSTDEYDIHYYNLGEEYAKIALDVLDTEFEEITDILGYAPFAKTKIFLYNSETELKESNVGVGAPVFTIAGETIFVKLMVEIAYPGSIIEFKKELRKKVALTLLNDMMFGGSLGDIFQSSYLLNLSEWFTEGAANYIAYGWDITMDDYVRDYLTKKKIQKFSKLEGEKAILIGQSVWNYIAVKYGPSNLSNILNLTRIIRNEQTSIASTLGISFEQFMYDWADYYGVPNELLADSYIVPEKEDRIAKETGVITKFTKLKISPDGTKVAYVENYLGRYKIVVRDIESGRERVVYKGGHHIIDQEVSYDLPLIDWQDSTKLGIVEAWYGTNSLLTLDVVNRTKQRKSLFRFTQINSISFNDNGKLAILSADSKGQTDLYLISMKRNAVKRLTKDDWDDLYPQFIPGTDAIVFSSNRTSDSLSVKPNKNIDAPETLNLFVFDLDTTNHVLRRLTNTVSNDIHPIPFDSENIFYLSDLKGINNVYKYNMTDEVFTQVTNFRTSLKEYDVNQYTRDLSYLMLNKGKSKIYLEQEYDLNRTVFTPPTLRHQVKQIEFMRARREAKQLSEKITITDEDESVVELDSLVLDEITGMYVPPDNFDVLFPQLNEKDQVKKLNYIDTDNYVFGAPTQEKAKQDSIPQVDNPFQYKHPNNLEDIDMDSDSLSNYLFPTPITSDSLDNFRHPMNHLFDDDDEKEVDKNDKISQLKKNIDYIDTESFIFGSLLSDKKSQSRPLSFDDDGNLISSEQFQFETDTSLLKIPRKKFVNTDEYKFEDEQDDVFSFLSIYMKIQEEPEIIGPLQFETSFNVDYLVTSIVLDQFRGMGFLIETQMSDILDNHIFNGGYMTALNLQSGDFYASYSYIKNTVDLKARYDRKVILEDGIDASGSAQVFQKYKLNKYTLGASLPITASSRFEINGFGATTRFLNIDPDAIANATGSNKTKNGSSNTFVGFNVGWIFDRTLINGLNLFEGSKGKVLFEHYQGLTDVTKSFSNLTVDLRRYQKIHRELIFATRLYYGQSFGNNPKTYMLGGMDNWVFNQRDNTDQLNTPLSFSNTKDNSDVLFAEFVNLRGFNYNRFSGQNVLALNAELRWPIFKYLTKGAIKSNFVRNFQVIGFYDLGSAWTGVSPFNKNNTVDTRIVKNFDNENAPFEAIIKTTRNPWLASYGFGLRTAIMDYYVRFDVAKPIEDYKVKSRHFYLTLGYDF